MGSSLTQHWRYLFAACLLAAVFGSAAAEDRRSEAIDAYLLIDRSAAMEKSGAAAAAWICDSVVDGMLQSGDRVTLWAFSDKPERIAETTLSDDGSKEALKQAIRSVGRDGGAADLSKAIRAVAEVEASRSDRSPIAYVLLASTLSHAVGGNGHGDSAAASLLRFSRIEDHPGWKAVTLGLGLEQRVEAAAAAFIESSKASRPRPGSATPPGGES